MLGGVLKNTNRPRSSIPVAMFGVYTLSMHTPSRELIYRLYREVIYIFVIKAPHIFWLQCHPQPSPPNTKSLCGLVAPKNHTTIVRISVYRSAACCHFWADPQSTLVSHPFHCSKRYASQPATAHCAQQTTVEHIYTYLHTLTWQ